MLERRIMLMLMLSAGCDNSVLWPCGFGPCDGGGTDGDGEELDLPTVEWLRDPCEMLMAADLGWECAEASYYTRTTEPLDPPVNDEASFGATGQYGLQSWILPRFRYWLDTSLSTAGIDGLMVYANKVDQLPGEATNVAAWVLADEGEGCPAIRNIDNALVPLDSTMAPVARVGEGVILCVFVPGVGQGPNFSYEENKEKWGDWGFNVFVGRFLAESSYSRSTVYTLHLSTQPVYDYVDSISAQAYAGWVGIRPTEPTGADESGG